MLFKPVCPVCGNPMSYLAVDVCDSHEDCILETYRCEDCDTWDEDHFDVFFDYDEMLDDIFSESED